MKNDKGCGIYVIECLPTCKKYVGKTINFQKRYNQYIYDLKSNNNYRVNQYLKNAFDKYGIENFKFSVLEYCTEDRLQEREYFWMIELDTLNHEKGFNLRFDSSSVSGVSDLTRDKISKRLKKEWRDGVRHNHSEKLSKNWSDNPERKQQQSRRLTSLLTRWLYIVNGEEPISYSELQELGLSGVLYKFHRKKSNLVSYKGFIIERIEHEG